jgi:PAS domain S-box-containing protein
MSAATIDSPLDSLVERNYRQIQDHIHSRTDRMFAWVMATQYVLCVLFALLVSPRTWSGAIQQTHPHVWTALGLGAVLASLPIFLALKNPGTFFTRLVIAVSQALFSALLIHLSGGRIETHFHVFGSLAFLAMYRDWRVLIAASIVVASDHLIRGIWFPFSVYGIASGAEWRFLEHAGWVLFEDAFLLVACATSVKEMRGMAARQAELELANDRIERNSAEIARQSAVLSSVLTSMSDGLIVVSPSGDFLHFNPAAEEILGSGSRELPMAEWSRAFQACRDENGVPYPPEEFPLARAMRGEPAGREEFVITRLGTGVPAWIEASAQPLRLGDQGNLGGMVVFRDITEPRRILDESARARREAERANNAKSEFLSRMSHELRTPMNAILGFGQLLKMDDLSADQDESLDQILKAGAHLLRLIDEVLDISGIEAGKLSISQEPVDSGSVIREVVSLVQPIAQASGIAIKIIPNNEDAFVLADQQRLLQVLLNLVSNAIKYNVEGGEVRIRAERQDALFRIGVEDTGIGIPSEKLAMLFKPFERIGAQHTEVQGTGLGLALSKRLTEAMGGRIGVTSNPSGSCFFVELLSAKCPVKALKEIGWAEQVQSSVQTVDATILFIEDNPANGRLMEKILESRPSYHLFLARTGQAGLDLACEHRPDLILLDIDLPDFSGHEVLRQLRRDARFEHTPVIVVSADATPSHVDGLRHLGISAYLTKPIEVTSFLSQLDESFTAKERKVA